MAVTMFTRFANLRNLMNVNNVSAISSGLSRTQYVCTVTDNRIGASIPANLDIQAKPRKKMSKAMKVYLQRSREHETLMQKEIAEFNIGKRHLANMMGENPEHFSQKDINKCIRYLFPSGLYEPKARPMMIHPLKIFEHRKAAEFDESGRPYHSLFYTSKPNFYQALYDIVEALEELNDIEDKMITCGKLPEPKDKFDSVSSIWIPKAKLEAQVCETLADRDYDQFIAAVDKLMNHPLSMSRIDIIKKYRKELRNISKEADILPLKYDKNGVPFVTVRRCKRKSARGEVILRGQASGKIIINNQDITYFKEVQHREQIFFPLLLTDMVGKIDVEATISGGGPTGQAGAIRWGIAWGLRSFLEKDSIEKMRLAGLLTRDLRKRERKKYGQEGARRKFTWKKR